MILSQAMSDTLMVSPAGITNGATNTSVIDTIGADYATIRVALSSIASATVASTDGTTIAITEADVNSTNATTFSTITTIPNQTGIKTGREVRYEIDTRQRKRFLRLALTPGTSGVSNEPVTACVFATLSRKEIGPSASGSQVAGTNDVVVIA